MVPDAVQAQAQWLIGYSVSSVSFKPTFIFKIIHCVTDAHPELPLPCAYCTFRRSRNKYTRLLRPLRLLPTAVIGAWTDGPKVKHIRRAVHLAKDVHCTDLSGYPAEPPPLVMSH